MFSCHLNLALPQATSRQEHFKVALRKTCRVVNLDPAAENFLYDCYADVFWPGQSPKVVGFLDGFFYWV